MLTSKLSGYSAPQCAIKSMCQGETVHNLPKGTSRSLPGFLGWCLLEVVSRLLEARDKQASGSERASSAMLLLSDKP